MGRANDVAHYALPHLPLYMLNLSGSQITDAGLANLSGMTNLNDLSLSNTSVTDAGTQEVAKLQSPQSSERRACDRFVFLRKSRHDLAVWLCQSLVSVFIFFICSIYLVLGCVRRGGGPKRPDFGFSCEAFSNAAGGLRVRIA